MGFIDTLISQDTQLLLFFNGMHNAFFDEFMLAFSGVKVWIPFYLSVIFIIIKQAKLKSVWLILALVLCVVIADQVSSSILKETVCRLRPSRNPELDGLVHLVKGHRYGLYGFVSSHAANTFGFALLSSLLIRKRNYAIAVFLWAAINSYSRIYLGVHYPLDVLGGIMVGTSAALICYWLIKKLLPAAFRFEFEYSTKQTYIPVYVLSLTVFSIIIYSIVVL